jgi:TonB family protein
MASPVDQQNPWLRRIKRSALPMLFVVAGGLGAACGSTPPPRQVSVSDRSPAQLCLEGPPKRADTVQVNQSMHRPKLVRQQPPVLTESIRSQRLEGLIATRCIINTEGILEDCCIVKSGGELDQPVIEAVRTWRYEPVTIEGKPLNVFYIILIKIKQ